MSGALATVADRSSVALRNGRPLWVSLAGSAAALIPSLAHASKDQGEQPLPIWLVIAALSLLPFLLVMVTSFVKISVVLSILRNALGTPQLPPTIVITGLSLVLTAYVMAPTGREVMKAVGQGRNGAPAEIFSKGAVRNLYETVKLAKEPVRRFLVKHSRQRDRKIFLDLARRMSEGENDESMGEQDLLVVIPAFIIGQLAAAFQIGFLIFVPLLVIDLVVANVLLALGMHMLSPTTVSLPFKLLLFVLIDGWVLLTRGLVMSYG